MAETVSQATRLAQQAYGRKSLRAHTNWQGCDTQFSVLPELRPYVSDHYNPQSLVKAKHAVEPFWTYDGAQATLHNHEKQPGSTDDILPPSKLQERDFIVYQRYGSKKGWLYNSPNQSKGPYWPEDKPTHTEDGWTEQIKNNRYTVMETSKEKQGMYSREIPFIDIQNNARGIGVSGPGKGQGGMAGGYQAINPQRLEKLPVPKASSNWTGSRPHGTARTDMAGGGTGAGAGGFRSGYLSQYPERPYIPDRRKMNTVAR